ncbi:MAG: phospho-sugar mutase [Treponema sp.]|nr:phospho-sugar mutase [Treponema sp.]
MDRHELLARARDYVARESDRGFREEVEALLAAADKSEALAELEERFYRDLEFGTGGLRGVIGGGFNRMNSLVVKSATQGLSTYLIKAFPEKAASGELQAAVAYDSRRFSAEFAEATALVFAANGIKTWLFSGMRPTPQLSFAMRRLGCDTGVVVTASHNPPQYNGYKAYWNDGSQVIGPHDEGIIEEVGKVKTIAEISRQEALDKGLLKIIGADMDEAYIAMVKSCMFRPDLIRAKGAEVKIVYTPLHGTGAMHVEKALGDLGLDVITVPQQREGDGSFPTVAFPNPEEAAALDMAIQLGKKEGADVVMATDPDADRFGIAIPDGKGGYALVTGNQTGALLADYIFLSLKEQGRLPKNAAMINSIVTTGMQKKVAQMHGVDCAECLTGFKWIADVMRKWEIGLAAGDPSARAFVFGTEESYGYNISGEVRDKDGISAAALTAEMTLYWRSLGKSLLQRLDELYMECGYWQELGISKYFEGPSGAATMKKIMDGWRAAPPKTLGGIAVAKTRDLERGADGLPASDALQFFLADGTVVSARPSGTEPKIKFYATCCADARSLGLEAAKAEAAHKLDAIARDVKRAIGN